ncbi:MAG: lysophospholipid acyltransferase family protein [Caldimonas sp.]
MTTLRASLRLGCSMLHALHGVSICALVFPFVDETARMRWVGWWSRRMLGLMGITLHANGEPSPAPALLLANHVSWLDILAIDAVHPARFVSKADVRHWPVLGFLVARGGTLFIERERRRDALRVVHQVAAALKEGATVAVFPEGTTSHGPTLLPFHANLLQAAITVGAPVQPVVLRFSDRSSTFSAAAAYVGETTLVRSLWQVACADSLEAHVTFLPPLSTLAVERRSLAAVVRAQIQSALDSRSASDAP